MPHIDDLHLNIYHFIFLYICTFVIVYIRHNAIIWRRSTRRLIRSNVSSILWSIVLILWFRALVVLGLLVHLLDSFEFFHLSLDEFWIRREVFVAAGELEVVVGSQSELARVAIEGKGIWIISCSETGGAIVIANIAIGETADKDFVIAAVRQDVAKVIIIAVTHFVSVSIRIGRL